MRPQQALRENYRVNLAQPDDFVISLSSHAHGIEHCGLEGGVSPDYTLLRPKCDPRLIPFLKYALKSSWIIFQLGAFKTGVRMGLRLTWNKVRYCKIGLPSPEEAERIADYLDGETSRIDGLIALTERSIDLLREKRAALITAAVTGKIDVRAAA
jgi:type I restriction enzyme S subunit